MTTIPAMTIVSGPLLPLVALVWPLLLGAAIALPRLRGHALLVLPLAPVPALAAALTGLSGVTEVPPLLLGTVLHAGRDGALLFGVTAAIWLAAGVAGSRSLTGLRRPAVFAGFWCLTFAGNLGVMLAADVATFYVAFAAVSLAAYVLVVAKGTDQALRAGRIYLTLAVLGEAALLLGFMLAVAEAGSLAVDDVRRVLAAQPLAAGLLALGFAVKAGVMPLHIWLPLAHPAAPVPASAVLSGAIVKAGLIGVILFLPHYPVLTVLGLVTLIGGAVLGLTQTRVKAMLAYSTVSQMGLVMALAGTGGATAATFYAAHHGLAKAALFLSVGLVAAVASRGRLVALALVGVAAASVAGVPLTGGAVTKAAAKAALGPAAELVVTLSGVTTTLLLMRVLTGLHGTRAGSGAGPVLWLPVAGLVGGALALPWVLGPGWSGLPGDYALHLSAIWSAGWPVGAGLLIAALAWRFGLALPRLPEGDLAPLAERWAFRLRQAFSAIPPPPLPGWDIARPWQGLMRLGARAEPVLSRLPVSGGLLVALALGLALLLSG
ncbi:complex I subunit 5 family protein [Halodurantibacterium flavum]|uniref:Complex I subunit 5 family protein n=1 Tax=Halodurantibacterium flavum TaxID=1382802 RepID=A0ABW4S6A3_9RHOB